MLARWQQLTTLGTLLIAFSWAAACWRHSPWAALAAFLLVVFFYALVLAIEFLALRSLNRNDPAPPATGAQLGRAWLGECLTVPQVFYWRQPFRSRAIADHLPVNGRQGVVFIHGFVCNRGLWNPWLARLQDGDHAFVAVNLEPVAGSIDAYVSTIEAAVRRITQCTGRPPVLVCHSMGGLAARAWMRQAADDSRVQHVVTIGTPHHGTWLGRFAHTRNGREMKLSSRWLEQLAADEPPARYARFTCWYSHCDNIVFPASTATLPGADNRLAAGMAHLQMAFNPDVMRATLARITAI